MRRGAGSESGSRPAPRSLLRAGGPGAATLERHTKLGSGVKIASLDLFLDKKGTCCLPVNLSLYPAGMARKVASATWKSAGGSASNRTALPVVG
jgi:hypothetical protein